jgi:predicted O-methyltransferase YrrM
LPITLLEVGVGMGCSLAAWADYFPNAQIIGVDTFARVSRWRLPIMGHPRVKAYKHDSTKETPPEVVAGSVDIIIDDGDHEPASQLATFERYFPLLKSGGLYFIEDVIMSCKGHGGLIVSLEAYKATHYDLRIGNNDGSYLIGVRHG